MNIEEYKAHVEAQRNALRLNSKASLLKAIATMSEANAMMSSLFNTEESK